MRNKLLFSLLALGAISVSAVLFSKRKETRHIAEDDKGEKKQRAVTVIFVDGTTDLEVNGFCKCYDVTVNSFLPEIRAYRLLFNEPMTEKAADRIAEEMRQAPIVEDVTVVDPPYTEADYENAEN